MTDFGKRTRHPPTVMIRPLAELEFVNLSVRLRLRWTNLSEEERARAVDKLNVDCIIRPRNDNSALLTSQPGNPTELLPRWNMLCSKEERGGGRGDGWAP